MGLEYIIMYMILASALILVLILYIDSNKKVNDIKNFPYNMTDEDMRKYNKENSHTTNEMLISEINDYMEMVVNYKEIIKTSKDPLTIVIAADGLDATNRLLYLSKKLLEYRIKSQKS